MNQTLECQIELPQVKSAGVKANSNLFGRMIQLPPTVGLEWASLREGVGWLTSTSMSETSLLDRMTQSLTVQRCLAGAYFLAHLWSVWDETTFLIFVLKLLHPFQVFLIYPKLFVTLFFIYSIFFFFFFFSACSCQKSKFES